MSRLQFGHHNEGHRVEAEGANDIDQRLTYQQLLTLNHDYARENMLLKNISNKLGNELRTLHTQFDIKPREENNEIYQAINQHPYLQSYEPTLIPLLQAYQNKIQEFEQNFEMMHEEFFTLEKKFEEACRENEKINVKLTAANKELMDLYKNGGSDSMHSDFGQLILDQVNERQKVLVEENSRLERDYQRYKSESDRFKNDLDRTSNQLDAAKSRIKDFEISHRQLELEIKNLKDNSFDLQIKANDIEIQKKKLDQAHERAQSQINNLNREKEIYKSKLEEFRNKMEKENQIPMDNDQNKLIEKLNTELEFLKAEKGPDTHQKLSKLQKEYEALSKQKNRLKEALNNSKIKEDELNQMIQEHRSQISTLELEKTVFQQNENKIKKSLETLVEKSKSDIKIQKKNASEELERVEFDFKHKLQMKDKRIDELEENYEKAKLEKQKIEREYQINGKGDGKRNSKDSDRAVAKMKEKIAINDQLFKQQTEIFKNDLAFMKRENQNLKAECKDKADEIKKLRAELEVMTGNYEEVVKEKNALLEEFRKVRTDFEINLKEKETIFEQKIREIKSIVQDLESRRRSDREKGQEASRKYKIVLEDIKSTYEARIRELENQPGAVTTQTRYRAETYNETPSY